MSLTINFVLVLGELVTLVVKMPFHIILCKLYPLLDQKQLKVAMEVWGIFSSWLETKQKNNSIANVTGFCRTMQFKY